MGQLYLTVDDDQDYEDYYDGLSPYVAPSSQYECPYNCKDMGTHNFLLYSLMVLTLGFLVGVLVGVWAC